MESVMDICLNSLKKTQLRNLKNHSDVLFYWDFSKAGRITDRLPIIISAIEYCKENSVNYTILDIPRCLVYDDNITFSGSNENRIPKCEGCRFIESCRPKKAYLARYGTHELLPVLSLRLDDINLVVKKKNMDFVKLDSGCEKELMSGNFCSAISKHRRSIGLITRIDFNLEEFNDFEISDEHIRLDELEMHLFLVRENLRKIVVMEGVDDKRLKSIRRAAAGDGILAKPGKRFGYDELHHIRDKSSKTFFNLYLSKDEKLIDHAISLEERYENADEDEKCEAARKLGGLFEYPSCCIDFYIRSLKDKERIPWKNRVFYESKGCPDHLLNFITPFRTFFHFPCSFSCKNTRQLSFLALKSYLRDYPDKAQLIEKLLNMPVLYFDYFRYIIFDGKVIFNRVEYKNIYCFSNFSPDFRKKSYFKLFYMDVFMKFKEGDSCEFLYDKIAIYKKSRRIHTIFKNYSYTANFLNWN
jgi:hypothetical protein